MIIERLKNKYLHMSAPAKAALWFTFSNIVQRGISVLSTPIFTRLMNTVQYGMYSVYQSWYNIIAVFATLNLYAGVYNNGMTNFSEDRPRFTSALQGLSTTVTLLLLLCYIVNPPFWNKILGLSTIYIVAMFIELLFVPAFLFWSAKQRYDYKYRKQVALALGIAFISPIVGVISVINTEYKAEARVLAYVTVQVIVGIALYINTLSKGRTFFDKKYWKYALAFNIPLIPHYLSQMVLNQSDRIMISRMIGPSQAAIYSVAYTVSMMMTIVTSAINNSFVPYTYKSMKEKNTDSLKSISVSLVVMVSVACVFAMAFGPEIIRIVAAPQYYEARWVIPPVAGALYFMFLFPLYCNIEFYFEETKCIMVASCFAAGLNILLNYFAIQWFGYIAAAYTTLICYILLALTHYFVHLWVLKKNGNSSMIYNSKFFLLLSIAIIVVMVLMTLIYDKLLIRYCVIALLIIAIIRKKTEIASIFNRIKKQ